MIYNFSYISEELKNQIEPATQALHRFDSLLGTRIFPNAFIAPYVGWEDSIGCLLDETGNIIKDSECLEWKESDQFYRVKDAVKEDGVAVYLGFLLTGFGHSYTDNLRKLWFVKTDLFQSLVASGALVVYTTSWNAPLPDILYDVFKLAGFDLSSARHITALTQFDKVYIPDNCFKSGDAGRIYSKEFEDLINCIKSGIPNNDNKSYPQKVYFSRSKFSKNLNKEFGEKSIERVFSRLGYDIIYPEDYSFAEQIHFVRNCDSFAATEGSVAHLSLFCNPQTHVILLNKANYLNFHQLLINEYADLDVTYIEAHHSSKVDLKHPWWGPFYLYITGYLERFVKHPIIHLPFWLAPSYWAYTRNILYRVYNRCRKFLRHAFAKG